MDVCCLNRPFDDQTQEKVRLETEAIVSILKRCSDNEDWTLVGSDIITLEALKNNDIVKRQKVLSMHSGASEKIKYTDAMKSRAVEFRKSNLKLFDSLHLAAAENANVDVFLSTDNRLIKAAARTDIRIRVENPLTYYMEVLTDESSCD